MPTERKIYVTTHDMKRLLALLEGTASVRNAEAAEALESELASAVVVAPDKIPDNVVTMNSRVRFQDEETGQEREITLVYPKDADPQQGKISILAPVGAALIGLSVGQSVDWPLPGGRLKRLKIVEVLFQPEAAGQPDL
ncbi:Regulator of nucleoside diphosphate kinase [Vulgatibacter incomptus]|uniref:Regulator of nucleoside diphosphate kinase n=2 Tax=Vulgatibacter incomptus TaxID=1391653 RepID=A0A0K1P9E2_9BACT|nr:nucleoside diphosphate kinase regulator [Vulgatibacter incomptus]AKU90132.1 Regulator of nucleoside diphosphate kinase [Vulgatibacter incomptus]